MDDQSEDQVTEATGHTAGHNGLVVLRRRFWMRAIQGIQPASQSSPEQGGKSGGHPGYAHGPELIPLRSNDFAQIGAGGPGDLYQGGLGPQASSGGHTEEGGKNHGRIVLWIEFSLVEADVVDDQLDFP